MSLTVKDMMKFILRHRGGRVFVNMSIPQIGYEIQQCLAHGFVLHTTDETGAMSGMVLALVDDEKQLIHVRENLAMNITNLRVFARHVHDKWPDYEVVWEKHGRRKHHDTQHFYKKFL